MLYDLVVIGGGPGGLGVALEAAQVGARVALIEKDEKNLGGECRNSACIPSKALLKAGGLAHQARHSSAFGVACGEVRVDFPAVMARIRALVASFHQGGPAYYRDKGIDLFFGSAAFEAYDSVVVDGKERVAGSRFVVVTGSRPALPEVPGLAGSGYLTNRTIWDLDALPESLAILGAGPVGLEFGQAFTRLGTKVTILDTHAEILHREDPEAAAMLRARLAAEGIAFYLAVEVTGIAPKDGKTLVKFRSKKDGATFEALRSHLLVAAGRLANVEGLNLEAAGIHASAEHGIPVDEALMTANPHVYALGDVIGRDPYTHAAEREAEVVFQNAVLKLSKKFRRDAVPRTVYTDFEFAAVGMTPAQAREDDPDALDFRVDLAKVDRARIDDEAGGMFRVVASPGGKVLGATIVAPSASLVLQEFTLAIELGLSLNDLATTHHPFPTYASAAWSLAGKFASQKREKGLMKTALKWVYGFEKAGKS